MTFIKRRIDVQMALNGDTFDGSSNTISLTGLRCQATIQSYNGSAGSFNFSMGLRISGMKNADMAKMSTLGFSSGANPNGSYVKNRIDVYAGDDDVGMSHVFSGGITYANVDYNAQPDVGLEIVANALADLQYAPIAASSYKGVMSVASMLEGVCKAANPPLAFVNNGVTAVLSNHATRGSARDQIKDICIAAGINYKVKNQTLFIWPNGGSVDSTIIDLGPNTGMIGYPCYSPTGIDVVSLFNPNIEFGRQIKVTSSTPKPAANAPAQVPGTLAGQGPLQIAGANGTFSVALVTHDLATEVPNGPWFTSARLVSNVFNAR